MKAKAVSYLRVSGKGQVKGDGFPRQRKAVANYASSHRIEIVEEFTDAGVSGTKELEDRDGLTALMARVGSNGVGLVLVESASRLARDLMVGEIILRELAKLGVQVIAAPRARIGAPARQPGRRRCATDRARAGRRLGRERE